MRFVSPSCCGHPMEGRTQYVTDISFRRIGQNRSIFCFLLENIRTDAIINLKLIQQTIVCVQIKDIRLIFYIRLTYIKHIATRGDFSFCTVFTCYKFSIIIESNLFVCTINSGNKMIPLITEQLHCRLTFNLPTSNITNKFITSTRTQLESKPFLTRRYLVVIIQFYIAQHRSKPLTILIQLHHWIRFRSYPKRKS